MNPGLLTDILVGIHKADAKEIMTLMPDWIGLEEPINNPNGKDPKSWRRRSMPSDCTLTHLILASRGEGTTQKAKSVYERIVHVRQVSGRSERSLEHYRDGTGGMLAGLVSGDAYDCGIGDLHSWSLLIELAHNAGWNLLYLLPRNMSSYGNSPYSVLNDLKDLVDIDLSQLFAQFPAASEASGFWQDKKTQEGVDIAKHGELVDYDAARALKVQILRLVFKQCRSQIDEDSGFKAYCKKQLPLWRNQIIHLLLREKFLTAKDFHNGWDWRLWPRYYHNSASKEFKQFLKDSHDEISFHLFGQWVYKKQWDALQLRAGQYNIKTISDLPYMPPEAAVYDEYIKTKGKPEIFLINPGTGRRDFVNGVPADMFGPPQFWQGTIYDFSNLKTWEYWKYRLSAEMEFADEVRFDHGFGLFRVYYFSQVPASWKSLGLWDEVLALRDYGLRSGDNEKWQAAKSLCSLVVESVKKIKQFLPYQKDIFDEHTGKLTLDTAFFISSRATICNSIQRWFENPNAQTQQKAKAALNNIFHDHPLWRDEDSGLFDGSLGRNYFYKDVFNSTGEPDIYRGELIARLEEKYSLAEHVLRYQVVDSWSFDDERYHDWRMVAGSNESRQHDYEKAAYEYLFRVSSGHAPAPEDKIVTAFFVYSGGKDKSDRVVNGGQKLIAQLREVAQEKGKDLVGEFLGASTVEIEKALEASGVCMFRVFQFGWPDNKENMNSPCRWLYLSHIIASVHDWYPLAGDKGIMNNKNLILNWMHHV